MKPSIAQALLRFGLPLLLPVFFFTCRPNDEGFGPNGEPRILAITLPGLPNRNIRIDQEAGQILLTLPADLPSVDFTPAFRFTPGTRILKNGGDFEPYRFNLCDLPDRNMLTVVSENSKAKTYSIVLYPAGPLGFGALPVPFEVGLDAGQPITLPLRNFYDGRSNTAEVTFSRKEGGLSATTTVSCSSEGPPNQFSVSLPPGLTLGEYTLEVKKPRGPAVKAPQVLAVKKGLPHVGTNYYYPPVVGETSEKLIGTNVYAEDGFVAVLTNRAGNEFRVQPRNFQPTGRASFDLSALPAGNYAVRLERNGQPTSARSRISVLQDKNQPAIHALGDLIGGFPEPLRLSRGARHHFIFTPIGGYNETYAARLKLSPTAGGQAVTVPVGDLSRYGGCGPDCGVPSFGLSAVPPGRYALTLLVETPGGPVRESAPLERDVVME